MRTPKKPRRLSSVKNFQLFLTSLKQMWVISVAEIYQKLCQQAFRCACVPPAMAPLDTQAMRIYQVLQGMTASLEADIALDNFNQKELIM